MSKKLKERLSELFDEEELSKDEQECLKEQMPFWMLFAFVPLPVICALLLVNVLATGAAFILAMLLTVFEYIIYVKVKKHGIIYISIRGLGLCVLCLIIELFVIYYCADFFGNERLAKWSQYLHQLI